MHDEKQPTSRAFILGVALISGVLLSVATQAVLAHLGLDLGGLWRGLRGPQATQLRAAFAWWLIAGISFVAGLVIAALAKFLSAHPIRSGSVQWLAGAAAVVLLTIVARQATAPSGLSPAAIVGIGLSVMCVAGILSLLGAFFVVRR
ncbi:MAG: hypothetical protein ACXW3G_11755 [Rhodoplanes sp.]